MDQLSRRQFRRVLLASQSLWPPRSLRGKTGALEILRKLRCVQYDSIDMVGRNHELVLQARVAGFRRPHLQQLLYQDRVLVDLWDKQMSIGPIEERKFFAPDRLKGQSHNRYREDGPLKEIFPLVRKELTDRGVLCSLDIESDVKANWAWAPTRAVRAALEALWFRGELTIARREGSRRYFDFTEKLLAAEFRDLPDPPSAESPQYLKWRILRRAASAGVLTAGTGDLWLGIDAAAAEKRRALAELVEAGDLSTLEVEGFKAPLYISNGDEKLMGRTLTQAPPPPKAAVIAPLDNLIWDRRLVRSLFDFDYVWEVYKSEARRRWGYYVLPILYGDRFVARFEPGRDRKARKLVVRKIWTEEGVRTSESMVEAVGVALRSLAAMDGLTEVAYPETNDPLGMALRRSGTGNRK